MNAYYSPRDEDTSLIRKIILVPWVSLLERLYCKAKFDSCAKHLGIFSRFSKAGFTLPRQLPAVSLASVSQRFQAIATNSGITTFSPSKLVRTVLKMAMHIHVYFHVVSAQHKSCSRIVALAQTYLNTSSNWPHFCTSLWSLSHQSHPLPRPPSLSLLLPRSLQAQLSPTPPHWPAPYVKFYSC